VKPSHAKTQRHGEKTDVEQELTEETEKDRQFDRPKMEKPSLFDRIEDAELRRTAATKLIEQEVTEITEIRESD
jgi:phage terminase small subunit